MSVTPAFGATDRAVCLSLSLLEESFWQPELDPREVRRGSLAFISVSSESGFHCLEARELQQLGSFASSCLWRCILPVRKLLLFSHTCTLGLPRERLFPACLTSLTHTHTVYTRTPQLPALSCLFSRQRKGTTPSVPIPPSSWLKVVLQDVV